MNYYNEFDPKAAAWLRELIHQGLIPPGDVDERSITEIKPHELSGYTQHHFFAGIGGWSLALRLAGWPDSCPVRTGSCPCQPFSAAGKQLGSADERHLWPVFRDLITFGEPTVTFGEQVASALGREWLAGVRADLEGLGYSVGAADLCAAGVGAPHIRQRLFWVADPKGQRRPRGHSGPRDAIGQPRSRADAKRCGPIGGLAYADGGNAGAEREQRSGKQRQQPEDGGTLRMGDADDAGPQGRVERGHRGNERSPWASSVALPCTDGKARRIEPSAFPLAHGIPGRVGLLRGYGNAIVPQIAAEFIQAFIEASVDRVTT